jgi:protein involved in polysaccharide export with SLBB domain
LAHAQDEGAPRDDYTVLPGDRLHLQLEVLVRPDSAFSFPLAGDISTKGRSVVELQTELTQRLGRYISSPVVTVSVIEVLRHRGPWK